MNLRTKQIYTKRGKHGELSLCVPFGGNSLQPGPLALMPRLPSYLSILLVGNKTLVSTFTNGKNVLAGGSNAPPDPPP